MQSPHRWLAPRLIADDGHRSSEKVAQPNWSELQDAGDFRDVTVGNNNFLSISG